MNNNDDILSSVKAVVESIFRHKGKIIAYNALVLLAAIVVILFWPRKYGSEAKVWLKIGRQNSRLDPTAATGKTIAVQKNDREDEIKSILDVITSRGVIENAVDKLTPEVVLGDAPLPGQESKPANPIAENLSYAVGSAVNLIKQIDPISDREEAIREIQKRVQVEAERKSNVVSLFYSTKSPALAQAVVSAVLDEYKVRHNQIHHTTGSQSFFEKQRGLLNHRVQESASALKKAKDEIGIASISGQRSMLEEEMLEVQKQKLTTTQRVSEAQALIAELASLLDRNPEYVQSEQRTVPSTGRDALRNQLYELQLQRMKLEQTYNEDNPLVLAARAREAKAAELMQTDSEEKRSETVKALNKIHQDLALDLAKAKANKAGFDAMLKTLSSQENELRNRMAQLNTSDIRIKQLERQLKLAEANFMSYSEKYEDARVDEALNASAISNLGIAQEPTFQEKPVSPSKVLVAAFSLAMMLAGTFGLIAFFHVIIDRDVLGEGDVEKLKKSMDIPVIVSIPERIGYQRTLR